MNKFNKLLAYILAWLLLISPALSVHADDLQELFAEEMFEDTSWDDAWEEWDDEIDSTSWGFFASDVVEVVEAWLDYVELSIPVVFDNNGDEIQNYEVVFNTSSISDSDPLDLISVMFNNVSSSNNTVVLEGLSSWTEYYFIVIPMNHNGVEWEYTTEATFTTMEDEMHAAAAMRLENVSYTNNNGEISVTWASNEGAEKVEVFLRHASESDYTKIGDANMTEAKFDILVSREGDYHVQLIPVDGLGNPVGSETVLTMKDIVFEREATVEEAPEVWPALNLLISLMLLTFIVYIVYRYNILRNN